MAANAAASLSDSPPPILLRGYGGVARRCLDLLADPERFDLFGSGVARIVRERRLTTLEVDAEPLGDLGPLGEGSACLDRRPEGRRPPGRLHVVAVHDRPAAAPDGSPPVPAGRPRCRRFPHTHRERRPASAPSPTPRREAANQLRLALKRRVVFVPAAGRWGDPRGLLIQGEKWSRLAPTVTRAAAFVPAQEMAGPARRRSGRRLARRRPSGRR